MKIIFFSNLSSPPHISSGGKFGRHKTIVFLNYTGQLPFSGGPPCASATPTFPQNGLVQPGLSFSALIIPDRRVNTQDIGVKKENDIKTRLRTSVHCALWWLMCRVATFVCLLAALFVELHWFCWMIQSNCFDTMATRQARAPQAKHLKPSLHFTFLTLITKILWSLSNFYP